MASSNRRADRLVRRLAQKYGFEVGKTHGGHYRLSAPGRTPVFTSGTPSCRRFGKNLEAELRRSIKDAKKKSNETPLHKGDT